MGADENTYLVNNSDRQDWMRREALCNLVRDGAVSHLTALVNNHDRPDWIRYGALDALCVFAQASDVAFSTTTASIRIGSESISMTSITVGISSIAHAAVQNLYNLANNYDRPDKMRRAALEALVAGGCSRECLAIADNSDCPDWMRKLAMKGL